MVGLLPLCATTVIEEYQRRAVPSSLDHAMKRLQQDPELLADSIHPTGPGHFGVNERGILALVNPDRLRRILSRMLDENEFLSPYGIRSLSQFHAEPSLFVLRGRPGIPGGLPARRSRTPACSAATPTGAGRSGCR